jgi:Methylase involved in ubiquinone/menaquinone biosynthesis
MSGKEKSVEIQPELLQNIAWGYEATLILSAAIELDVCTAINVGNGTVEKIARAIGIPLRPARMLLDALVGMEVLGKARGAYKLTPESKAFLVKGEPDYLGSFLQVNQGRMMDWFKLTGALKSGRPLEKTGNPGDRQSFFAELVKEIFPISYASGVILCKKLGVGKSLKSMKVLDVGCGSAAWSIAFALADNTAQVTGLDFPEVLNVAKNYVQRFRLQKQFDFKPGDYHQVDFGHSAYDAVILGQICHIEGEAGTKKLFKKAFDALKPGGKLLVAEFIANDLRTAPKLPLMFAMNMLMYSEHGDVFTAKELKRWLDFTGFKKVSAQAVQYPASVMVATK